MYTIITYSQHSIGSPIQYNRKEKGKEKEGKDKNIGKQKKHYLYLQKTCLCK